MKRALLLLVLFSLPAAAFSDEPRSIQVNGEGTVKIEPDQVRLQFGIDSVDKDLTKAKDDNTRKSRALLDALKRVDVATKDIQTGYIQIHPNYDYLNGRQTFTGYTVSKQLSVTLRDLQNYGKVLNAVVDAGADRVDGVQFETSKIDELKNEARKHAVADAKAKAELLAAQLNQKVGQPLMIQEGTAASEPIYPMRGMMAMKATKQSPEDTLSPGEMTVNASVTVRFELR